MCHEVNVGGTWCSTVDDLEKALGVKIVKEACYRVAPTGGECLCGVDIAATAAQRGDLDATKDDCGDWHIYRK